jgi:hypothetical protein
MQICVRGNGEMAKAISFTLFLSRSLSLFLSLCCGCVEWLLAPVVWAEADGTTAFLGFGHAFSTKFTSNS